MTDSPVIPPPAPRPTPTGDWFKHAAVLAEFELGELRERFDLDTDAVRALLSASYAAPGRSPQFPTERVKRPKMGSVASPVIRVLVLRRDARRAALATFASAAELRAFRATVTPPSPAGPLQNAFDRRLNGELLDLATMTEDDLMNAEQVDGWLAGLPAADGLGGTPAADVTRHLTFLRLVRPLADLVPEPFVGRDAEADRLLKFIRDRQPYSPPPLVVWGKGGVGKSALVAHVALRVLGAKPSGARSRAEFRVARTEPAAGGGPVVFLDLTSPSFWPRLSRRLVDATARQLAAQAPMSDGGPQLPADRAWEGEPGKVVEDAVVAIGNYCRRVWGDAPMLVMVEGYDRIQEANGQPSHAEFWAFMTALRARLRQPRILTTARTLGVLGTPAAGQQVVEHVQLHDLGSAACDELLGRLGVPEEHRSPIRVVTTCTPKLVRRAARVYEKMVADGISFSPENLDDRYRQEWGATPGYRPPAPPVPKPPDDFIAHPYPLSPLGGLIGRRRELGALTAWGGDGDPFGGPRVLTVLAPGGVGKSALTWEWFRKAPGFAGRIWWSFYETGAGFEEFVKRALDYVTHGAILAGADVPLGERCEQLLAALNAEPFLLVLDGFERQLSAYACLDTETVDARFDLDTRAARLYRFGPKTMDRVRTPSSTDGAADAPPDLDGQVGGEFRFGARKMYRASAAGPQPPGREFVGAAPCRQLLRQLSGLRKGRVLVSSRLFPVDFQSADGAAITGAAVWRLGGLDESAAGELWQRRAKADKSKLPSWFGKGEQHDRHPLLIQAVAGAVCHDPVANRNLHTWAGLAGLSGNVEGTVSLVLRAAVRSLPTRQADVLAHLALIRMATPFETLQEVLVGPAGVVDTTAELRAALRGLFERGLAGRSPDQRYDLHPLVRGAVTTSLTSTDDPRRDDVFARLAVYFSQSPPLSDMTKATPQAVAPHLEYYYLLICQERWDAAWEQFQKHLGYVSRNVFGQMRERLTWLEALFDGGTRGQLRVEAPRARAQVYQAVADAYLFLARYPDAEEAALRGLAEPTDDAGRSALEQVTAYACYSQARFDDAEYHARRAVAHARAAGDEQAEAGSLMYLTWVYLKIEHPDLGRVFGRARQLLESRKEVWNAALIATELFLSTDKLADARGQCERMLADAARTKHEFGLTIGRAKVGEVELAAGNLDVARSALNEALQRSIAGGYVYKQTDVVLLLGRVDAEAGLWAEARRRAEEALQLAEEGHHRLAQLGAQALLARAAAALATDDGLRAEAVTLARKAYVLAWGKGRPYAYEWCIRTAEKVLKDLKEEPPADLPMFNPAARQLEPLDLIPQTKGDPPPDAGATPDDLVRVWPAELRQSLGWDAADRQVRRWWLDLASRTDPTVIRHVGEMMNDRKVPLALFVTAYDEAGTPDLKAVLYYSQYLRRKGELAADVRRRAVEKRPVLRRGGLEADVMKAELVRRKATSEDYQLAVQHCGSTDDRDLILPFLDYQLRKKQYEAEQSDLSTRVAPPAAGGAEAAVTT